LILSARFEQALAYATILDSGQVKKGTAIPYIGHLLTVTGIALEHGADEDEAIAALLHDAVEDAGGKEHLRREQNPSVLLEKTPTSPLVLELARVVSELDALAAGAQPTPEVRR
jgi:hypothetical protein